MSDKPNFLLVPDEPDDPPPPVTLLDRLRVWLTLRPTDVPPAPARPRLIFGFDATASREPAWATARQVTDSLFTALPGALDIALAVHGGSRLHTFTEFTANPATLRDRAAAIACLSGRTQFLPILSRALSNPGVRVVLYIGDVFEESPTRARRLADAMGASGIKLIVLHDTADWLARRDAEIFQDLARRTGGCVLPFDPSAVQRLRELLQAVAAYAVGGTDLLQAKQTELPGAALLLQYLPARE